MKLQYLSICLLLASALVGCDKKEEPKPAAEPSSGGYLGTITKAQQSMVRKIDTVAIDQAIQQFNIQEGRFPKDLNELVAKKYLSEMPTPPNGQKFDYNAQTGVIKIVPQ